jgi:hypothetical protein
MTVQRTPRSPTCGVGVVLAAALLVRCTAVRASAAPTYRDSAGIALIEYPATFTAAGGRHWSTDPDPLFSIGETAPELFRVRSALFQLDGGVVVANGGASELLLFDSGGHLRARAGSQGGGPGEFHQLGALSIGPGDSLYAYDERQRRLSVFDRDGAFARALTLQGLDTLGYADQVGVLRNGLIVGAFRRRTSGVGLVRDSLAVVTFTSSGAVAARLGMFPHAYVDWGPHAVPGGGFAAIPAPAPLSSVTAVGLGDSAIYVGVPDPFALIRMTPDGTRRVTRQRAVPPSVTVADRERLLTALAKEDRVLARDLDYVRGLKSPPTLPAFGFDAYTARVGEQALLVTDAGGVWLLPFQFPDDSVSAPWPRFDAEGRYEGTVTLPARFRATDVRGDMVLGVYKDSTDVELVRAYRVISAQ